MKKIKVLIGIAGLLAMLTSANAQTIVNGNVSGTWTTTGSPYIISANATVPSGQSLTIQPGVNVWIGQGISLTINGAISAIGTSSQHIVFKAPISSQYWNTIANYSALNSVFNYCDFYNATNALAFLGACPTNQITSCSFSNILGTAVYFNNAGSSSNIVTASSFQSVSNGITALVNQNNWTNSVYIQNCIFANCCGIAINGSAYGSSGYIYGNNATVFVTAMNSVFSNTYSACAFSLYGSQYPYYSQPIGYGYGNVTIMDNLFNNITNTTIMLTSGSFAGNGFATLINNVILNTRNGIVSQDPWDATMMNSILVGCTNAVTDTGTLSRNIEFNDFYNNATNFIGYTSDYGTIIFANRNGTPCDLLFNIYSNPLFVSATNYALQTNSPCIDAGSPNAAYADVSFPPSKGTTLPDLGIYGGQLAANWLAVVPTNPPATSLSVSRAIKLTYNGVLAGGSYQLQSATKLTNWSNYGSPFYINAASNLVQYVDATNSAGFFRLQSLQ